MLTVPYGANAVPLGYGDWIGEFSRPGGGFVQEDDIEAHTGADVTMIAGWEGGPVEGRDLFAWTVTERDTGHATAGEWDYLGTDHLDLYLSIKYDGMYSIFHYASVNASDEGLWSSDSDRTGLPMTQHPSGEPFNVAQIRMWSAEEEVPPIPLPGALILFSSALLGLVGLRRGRSKDGAVA